MENRTLTAQTGAMEAMGRIAAQPAENALRQAQARAQTALAQQNEAEQLDKALEARLGAGYSQQLLSRGTGPLSSPMQGDAATAMENEANWREAQGAPRKGIHDLRVGASKLRQEAASAAKARADADDSAAQTRDKNSAAMLRGIQHATSSFEAYTTEFPKLNGPGSPLAGQLSGNFAKDSQILAQYALGSVTEDQRQDNARAKAQLALNSAQLATQQTTARTASTVATKRVELMDVQIDALKLAGGNGTVESEVAGDALRYAKYQKLVADREAEYPAAYRNSNALTVGRTYTLKDSSLGRLEVDPKTGVKSWAIIKPALVAPPTPRTREDVIAGRKAALANSNVGGD